MKTRTAWMLCFVWMGVIFSMSAMPGSASTQTSGRLMQLILSFLGMFTDTARLSAQALDTIHFLLRKGAHMTEYAVLFLQYRHALRLSGAGRPGVYALLMAAGYAATDEFHQSFVDARGPSAVDMMIDTAGAALAWACVWGWDLLRRRRAR